MKSEKILTIGMWVLVGISVILLLGLSFNIGEETDPTMGAWIDRNLVWSYILFAITAATAVIFGIVQTATDKAAAKSALISLVFAVVVFGIAYLLSPNEMPKFRGVENFIADGSLTPAISKWIDTGLIVSYILFGLTLLATVYWAVIGVVKK